MNRSVLSLLVACLLSVACATTRPTVRATPAVQASESQGQEMTGEELRRHRTEQADMRRGYHAAFDGGRVLMIDLLEGSGGQGAWYVSYSLMPRRDADARQMQIGGSECLITSTSHPTCAVVVPPQYEEFFLYVRFAGPEHVRFDGRLRVRLGDGEVVEYRTAQYEIGENIMAPSRALDAREAHQATATPVSR